MKLQGKDVYLDTLEREDCRKIWQDTEYDFDNPTEDLNLGMSVEQADEWFVEMQKLQGKRNIRLGVFLQDGTPIGDVALQNMDMRDRSCSIGLGIAKICNRGKGYGQQALKLIVQYGFCYVGMERITANTLEMNQGARRVLEKLGFTLEGRERKAVYMNGKRWDRLNYAILKEEFREKTSFGVQESNEV